MKIKRKNDTQILLTLMLTFSTLFYGCGKDPEVALEETIVRAMQKDRKLSENKRLKQAEEFLDNTTKAAHEFNDKMGQIMAEHYRKKKEELGPSEGPSFLEEIQEKEKELRRMKEEQGQLSTEL